MQRHFRNLDLDNYSAIGKRAEQLEKSLIRSVLSDMTKIQKRQVEVNDRGKFDFLVNKWEAYRNSLETSRELLLMAYKKKYRAKRMITLAFLARIRK